MENYNYKTPTPMKPWTVDNDDDDVMDFESIPSQSTTLHQNAPLKRLHRDFKCDALTLQKLISNIKDKCTTHQLQKGF
eukprot:129171-Ditylum_brightwellii.AAC.1